MKKIYIHGRHDAIMFDPETDQVQEAPYTRTSVRDVLLVKEPAKLIYTLGEQHYEEDVDVDDIVVIFYSGTFEKGFTVVKGNEDWVNNLKKYEAEEQKRKEEWAAKKLEPQDECAECCCDEPA